ncbi:unnamed protein product [Trifolium pratense]|uniref:Uncharacterized protein n=1 Tax=Trifolium pratense TaxID=57577 RepID=A0ACB0KDZ4_TRIPR|nr:unnamed protein product [Trifolium pratense]
MFTRFFTCRVKPRDCMESHGNRMAQFPMPPHAIGWRKWQSCHQYEDGAFPDAATCHRMAEMEALPCFLKGGFGRVAVLSSVQKRWKLNILHDNNALKVHNQCRFDPPNDAIIPLLEQCGFGYVVRLRKCMLDAHLITVMVLRWRPDMHTFQLPSGECTITLQDVNMLLDLQISGQAVSGRNDSVWEQFPRLLGVNPPERKHGYSIRKAWLKEQLSSMPPNPNEEQAMQQLRIDYMPYVSDNYYLNDPRPRPDMPPQYVNSPHSYTQQQQQYTNIPYTQQQQQQETCIPDPPPFTQQQQPFTQHTMPFTESDFMTPQQLTRNFFGYDRADFESPGTRQFNESYSNYFPPGEFTQPQQTQQVSQDLAWTELSRNYLNSTWTQGQGSTSAFGQPAPRNEGINFLGVPDNNPNEDDGDVVIFGVGLRARTRPPCGTGGCL